MTNAHKFALAGAAVLVLAVLGIGIYFGQSGRPGVIGPTPSSTPASTSVAGQTPVAREVPTASQPPSPAASIPRTGDTLAPGRYAISTRAGYYQYPTARLTVPAGYTAIGEGKWVWAIAKVGAEPTAFSGVGMWDVEAVYEDPCHWSATRIDTQSLGGTDFLAVLAAEPDRHATEPVDVTVDGYSGKRLQLSVSTGVAFEAGVFTDCDEGEYRSWPGRSHQGPSQIDDIRVIEIPERWGYFFETPPPFYGDRLIIATTYFPTTSAQDRAELEAMVESIDILLP